MNDRYVLKAWIGRKTEPKRGLVVPEIGDPDSFEAAYEKWRKDLALYSANAKQCSAEIRRRFSSKTMAEQYAASWEKAMREFGIGK